MPMPLPASGSRSDETACPAALSAEGLAVDIAGRTILAGVEVTIRRGRITALCGPNGSGKSTVLRTLCRMVAPVSGTVRIDGENIAEMSPRAIARRLAFLPQAAETPDGVTVRELVGFGRHPHRGLLSGFGREDVEAVDWAIEATGLRDLADRSVGALSGGERQRAWIAMALAQRTGILLLDEPTTYLDIRHQMDVLRLLRTLNRDHGLTIVWVLHDLNQAALFSDDLILLKDGRIRAEGVPERVLDPDLVADVFGVAMTALSHPVTGAPILIPTDGGDMVPP